MASGFEFKLWGIPVRIQLIFFAVIFFLGIIAPSAVFVVSFVVIATVSILLHELGHAVAFRRYGLEPRITLHAMGGLTSASSPTDDRSFTPTRSIVTSLAGPLAALVILGIPALVYAHRLGFDPWLYLTPQRLTSRRTPQEIIASQIIYINVGWSLLNLIPILPLDGGNVTASMCELVSRRQGRRVANVISIGVALALALLGYPYLGIVAPIFALVFIGMNINDLTKRREDTVDDDLAAALRALLDFDPVRADQLTAAVLARNPSPERRQWAIELAAWCRLAIGDAWGAQHLLVTMPPGSAPSASIRGALALAMGNVSEGVSTVAWALVHDPARNTKALASIAVAQAGLTRAVASELLLMGPEGQQSATVFAGLLDHIGHRGEGAEVAQLAAAAAPRPPGW